MSVIYPIVTGVALWSGADLWWIGLPLNLILLPTLDTWLWRRGWQPSQRLKSFSHSYGMMLALSIANWIVIVVALRHASSGMRLLDFLGLASTVGIMVGSSSLPAAHELVHRRARRERALGMVFLLSATYPQFRIEHVYGHHRNVGTREDPGTVRSDENFAAFFYRAILSGIRSAWNIECARLTRGGQSIWSLENRFLWYAAAEIVIYLSIGIILGATATLLMALQSLVAIHLLEAANYLQHFDISREDEAGLAPVAASHSWDCASPLSGLLLFGLPTHAQHHIDPAISGPELTIHVGAPKINISFYWAIFAVLVPGALKKILNGETNRRGKLEA